MLGVVGMDFDMERLHNILNEIRYEVFNNDTEVVLSLFCRPKDSTPFSTNMSIISSSNIDMYGK